MDPRACRGDHALSTFRIRKSLAYLTIFTPLPFINLDLASFFPDTIKFQDRKTLRPIIPSIRDLGLVFRF